MLIFCLIVSSTAFETDAATDDKRLAAARYAINITQCELCLKRQSNMSPDYFIQKNPNEKDITYIVAITQCVACISGNFA